MLRKAKSWTHIATIFFMVSAADLYWMPVPRAAASEPRILKNPYGDIDWDKVIPYMANLHCHTIYSDGRAEPDQLIRAYAEAGYAILAITDHDNYYTCRKGERDPGATLETTWPWTRWIDERPARIWKSGDMETAAFYPGLGRQGMLAIRGNELTSDPHIVSLFNDCGFPTRSLVPNAKHDDQRIGCVQEKKGIAFWAHPAIYVPPHNWQNRFNGSLDNTLAHFGDFLVRYDCLLGIEVNQSDVASRMPEALTILDRLLNTHYRDRDIFLFGDDDSHLTSVAEDSVFTIVMAEELTAEAVRHALTHGHTFVGHRTKTPPLFQRITVDEEAKTISLDIQNCDRVVWIKDGKEHGEGLQFHYAELMDSIVRFQVTVSDATFYSQAFHIGKK
ncbi:MAG: hypothetical protein JW829_11140 [Pirellulales bacterium]|nr:hypothetical protein [Pirellulales bacterium]